MAFCGGPTTQSPGVTTAQILATKVDAVGGSTIRIRANVRSDYKGKYFSLFVNGVYTGKNYPVPDNGALEVFYICHPGTTVGSAWFEDAGQWAVFNDDYEPDDQVIADEALTAMRIQMKWEAPYEITAVRNDTQLTLITITGAKRGVNVAKTSFTTRGKLHYQILTSSSGDYIVRWWAGRTLVAEGSRTGNGELTCDEINDSGLSIVCTITFTGNVNPGTAFLEVVWPTSYQVHYSTGALVYPRAPENRRYDIGEDELDFLTPVLAGGTYNWNILPEDDCGDIQTTLIVAPTSLIINAAPEAPVITSVTGSAAALLVNWTVGEAGCTYRVFSSFPNCATNIGDFSVPAIKTTIADATFQLLDPVINYPGIVRIIVRATKTGVEENIDKVYEVELDSTGAIVNPRPNRANPQRITVAAGRIISVDTAISTDDTVGTATFLDLFVVALASTTAINPEVDVPQASVALDAAVNGVQRKTISYAVAASGWYRLVVTARTTAGGKSKLFNEYIINVKDSWTTSVLNLRGKVIRGK